MKLILIASFIFTLCLTAFPQKLTEPQLLGTWLAGEDPSEFIYHRVLETSLENLKENPNGKLVIRVCSPDEFSIAFIKTELNPLYITTYGFYSVLTPERVFIARASKCLYKNKFNVSEYWFVPGKNTLEYDEILPVSGIFHKSFAVDDYDFEHNKYKKTSVEEKQFTENVIGFTTALKNNSKAEGFIVHNSKNKWLKRNIEKVKAILERENIDLQRIRTVVKVRLDINENAVLVAIKDEKRYFPVLEVIALKK